MNAQINSESNLSRIKEQLSQGRRITVQSVLRSIGTQELRHYISIIRKDMPVCSRWVEKRGKRFKEYWLNRKDLAA